MSVATQAEAQKALNGLSMKWAAVFGSLDKRIAAGEYTWAAKIIRGISTELAAPPLRTAWEMDLTVGDFGKYALKTARWLLEFADLRIKQAIGSLPPAYQAMLDPAPVVAVVPADSPAAADIAVAVANGNGSASGGFQPGPVATIAPGAPPGYSQTQDMLWWYEQGTPMDAPQVSRAERERNAALAWGALMPWPWAQLQATPWFELAVQIPWRGALRGLQEYQIKELMWWLESLQWHPGVDQLVMMLLAMPGVVFDAYRMAYDSLPADKKQRYQDMVQWVGDVLTQQAWASYTPEQLQQHATEVTEHVKKTIPATSDIVIGPSTSSGTEAWRVFEGQTKSPWYEGLIKGAAVGLGLYAAVTLLGKAR
jgi:hypothetical protein